MDPGLVQTNQWKEFRSACQQHFDVCKTMLTKLGGKHSSKDVIEKYHRDTCNSPLKVLKCHLAQVNIVMIDITALYWTEVIYPVMNIRL